MMMMGGNMSGGGSMGMDSMMNMGGGSSMQGMQQGTQGMQQGMQGMQNMPGMDPNAMNNMMSNHNAAIGGQGGFGFHGGYNGGLGGGFNDIFSGIFNLAFDLLAILLVVGIIVGIVVFLKKYLFEGQLGSLVNTNKVVCTKCGHTINAQWGFCPNCGASKVTPQVAVKEEVAPAQK